VEWEQAKEAKQLTWKDVVLFVVLEWNWTRSMQRIAVYFRLANVNVNFCHIMLHTAILP